MPGQKLSINGHSNPGADSLPSKTDCKLLKMHKLRWPQTCNYLGCDGYLKT